MLNWANRFNICCLLDNHNYNLPYNSYECLLAAGAIKIFKHGADFFSSLSLFYKQTNDWIFGHFNYDLKNRIENLQSLHEDQIGFAEAFLFVPEVVIKLYPHQVFVGSTNNNAEIIYNDICNETTLLQKPSPVSVKPGISKEKYIKTINHLKDHIKRGDCYEINYCQHFFSENVHLQPATLFTRLTEVSPNPFSAFYKLNKKYLVCASPERYIKKTGKQVISQPIKGTIRRNTGNREKDVHLKQQLYESAKDRSENVMVVDLVRNDLSKICKKGTVNVQELYGIYSFPQVHQMISTITGEMKDDIDLSDILQATFPMGSMTGAPKKKVMELIEQYEHTKRGIFSGTLGYITPEKDFDFNVVIRSLMYNAANRYLCYQVGGGITNNSDPEKEYQECLLKAEAIRKVLE